MTGLLICVGVLITVGIIVQIGQSLTNWNKTRQDKKINEELELEFYSQENFDPVGKMLDEYKKEKQNEKTNNTTTDSGYSITE